MSEQHRVVFEIEPNDPNDMVRIWRAIQDAVPLLRESIAAHVWLYPQEYLADVQAKHGERIAKAIEAERDPDDVSDYGRGYLDGLNDAALIARNGGQEPAPTVG